MRNMEALDYIILLTCGLRRPSVSRERSGSNLDRDFFFIWCLLTFMELCIVIQFLQNDQQDATV
jgi:hypothetical protein